MITYTTVKDCRAYLADNRAHGTSLGFVPTMGALHEGHIRLVKRSVAENDLTAVSIFVNPIQFNNSDDLRNYPRTLEEDTRKLEEAGCNLLFAPSVEEMYPEPDHTIYNFGPLAMVQEGAHRPGHFNGVAIVVRRLLEIIEPQKAYFGEKDYQQLLIIKALVKMCGLPVVIVPCPIVREPTGLAMSSRNVRLSPDEKAAAPVICKTLMGMRDKVRTMTVSELTTWAIEQIESKKVLSVEYLEIADAAGLQPVNDLEDADSVIVTVAVFAGKVRLIDNMILI